MNKELLTKNDMLKELGIESNALESLIDNGKIPYYEFKGDMGFNISEINELLSNNDLIKVKSTKFKPLVKIVNKLFNLLSRIIPFFYALGKLIEMSLKGLIGV